MLQIALSSDKRGQDGIGDAELIDVIMPERDFGEAGFWMVCCRKANEGGSIRADGMRESYIKDDGWPIGIGVQPQVSNHPKRLCLRGMVVSVGVKVLEMTSGRYVSERRAKANFR
jgi:hypothetical protein